MARLYFLLFFHGISCTDVAGRNYQGDHDWRDLELGRKTNLEAKIAFRELMEEFSLPMSMSIHFDSPAPDPAGTMAPTTATSATTPTTQAPTEATSRTSSPTTAANAPTPPTQAPSAAPPGSDSPVPIVTLPPTSSLTQTPTSTPSWIEAPTSAPISEGVGGLTCEGLSRSIVRVLLDVETAPGVGSFVLALEVALLNALSVDFPLCDIAQFSGRKLVDDFRLGGVDASLSSGGESCTKESILADTCIVVLGEFVVVGDDQNVAVLDLPNALRLIFQDDRAFDDELLNAQVVNVTLHEPDNVDTEDPFNDTPDIGTGQDPTVERSGLVASLSVAAGTVILALLFRKALKAAAAAGEDKDELQSHDGTIPHSVAYHV